MAFDGLEREVGRKRQESVLVYWDYPLNVAWGHQRRLFRGERSVLLPGCMGEGAP